MATVEPDFWRAVAPTRQDSSIAATVLLALAAAAPRPGGAFPAASVAAADRAAVSWPSAADAVESARRQLASTRARRRSPSLGPAVPTGGGPAGRLPGSSRGGGCPSRDDVLGRSGADLAAAGISPLAAAVPSMGRTSPGMQTPLDRRVSLFAATFRSPGAQAASTREPLGPDSVNEGAGGPLPYGILPQEVGSGAAGAAPTGAASPGGQSPAVGGLTGSSYSGGLVGVPSAVPDAQALRLLQHAACFWGKLDSGAIPPRPLGALRGGQLRPSPAAASPGGRSGGSAAGSWPPTAVAGTARSSSTAADGGSPKGGDVFTGSPHGGWSKGGQAVPVTPQELRRIHEVLEPSPGDVTASGSFGHYGAVVLDAAGRPMVFGDAVMPTVAATDAYRGVVVLDRGTALLRVASEAVGAAPLGGANTARGKTRPAGGLGAVGCCTQTGKSSKGSPAGVAGAHPSDMTQQVTARMYQPPPVHDEALAALDDPAAVAAAAGTSAISVTCTAPLMAEAAVERAAVAAKRDATASGNKRGRAAGSSRGSHAGSSSSVATDAVAVHKGAEVASALIAGGELYLAGSFEEGQPPPTKPGTMPRGVNLPLADGDASAQATTTTHETDPPDTSTTGQPGGGSSTSREPTASESAVQAHRRGSTAVGAGGWGIFRSSQWKLVCNDVAACVGSRGRLAVAQSTGAVHMLSQTAVAYSPSHGLLPFRSCRRLALGQGPDVFVVSDDTERSLFKCTASVRVGSTPRSVTTMRGCAVTRVAAGYLFALVIDAAGCVWANGRNDKGQLGIGSTGDIVRPFTLVKPLAERFVIVAGAAGRVHCAIVSRGGTVFVAGDNTYGQLGLGLDYVPPPLAQPAVAREPTEPDVPAPATRSGAPLRPDRGHAAPVPCFTSVPLPGPCAGVWCGPYCTAFVLRDGRVLTCGVNDRGQLGHPPCRVVARPTEIKSLHLRGILGLQGGAAMAVVDESARLEVTGAAGASGLSRPGSIRRPEKVGAKKKCCGGCVVQ